MKNITLKLFAAIFFISGIASFVYPAVIEHDKSARWAELKKQCNTAISSNARINDVDKACTKDGILKKYELIEGFIYISFMWFGMVTIFLYYRNVNDANALTETKIPSSADDLSA